MTVWVYWNEDEESGVEIGTMSSTNRAFREIEDTLVEANGGDREYVLDEYDPLLGCQHGVDKPLEASLWQKILDQAEDVLNELGDNLSDEAKYPLERILEAKAQILADVGVTSRGGAAPSAATGE